jgi:hypothetical protein
MSSKKKLLALCIMAMKYLGVMFVVIMASEATYDLFPYGFIEKAFPVFCMNREQKSEMLKKQAQNDSNWLADVKQKAVKNNVSEENSIDERY